MAYHNVIKENLMRMSVQQLIDYLQKITDKNMIVITYGVTESTCVKNTFFDAGDMAVENGSQYGMEDKEVLVIHARDFV